MPLLLLIPEFIGGAWAAITASGAWIVAKVIAKKFIIGVQVKLSIILIVAHFSMLGFFFYIIAFIFNKYNELNTLISNMATHSEILALTLNILQSMGVINAFNDVFAIFSEPLLAYLVYKGLVVIFKSAEHTSNELFKVGVLTQE